VIRTKHRKPAPVEIHIGHGRAPPTSRKFDLTENVL
jgi:hypothetical protein